MADPTVESATIAYTLPTTDLATVRQLVIAQNPNIVPELVTGNTVAELTASVENARQAHDRIANRFNPPSTSEASAGTADVATQVTGQVAVTAATDGGTPAVVTPAVAVPAGGAASIPLAGLPPMELIKRGMAALKAQT